MMKVLNMEKFFFKLKKNFQHIILNMPIQIIYLKCLICMNLKQSRLVEKKISLPAYDQCLKASHVFNILDARGAISVAQRAGYIGRIRDITKAVAEMWLSSQIE